MVNVHLNLNGLQFGSRVLKETKTIAQKAIGSKVFIVGLKEDSLPVKEDLSFDRTLYRITLKSRFLPKNVLAQLVKYVEFLIKSYILTKRVNATVISIHSASLLPVGVILKILLRSKLVYEAHELETEANGLVGLRKKLAKITEKTLIAQVNATIVVSEGIKTWYKTSYNLNNIKTVTNCPPYRTHKKMNLLREELRIPEEKKILLYQGAIVEGRGIELILSTAKTLAPKDYAFVFLGYGELTSVVKAEAAESKNIYYLPARTPDVLLDYTSSADIGLALTENVGASDDLSLPNKLFEYVMARIPVVVSPLKEMSMLVNKMRIGAVMQDWTPAELSHAIRTVESTDKATLHSALSFAAQELCWEHQEAIVLDTYNELAQS